MLENLKDNIFEYKKLSLEEQQQRKILGRLVGVMADFKKPTRNGRFYSEQLWEKTFKDPLIEERINSRTFFGELGHPVGRLETDMEKIAICLAEKPKKGKDGLLYGVFDILDTPNGRILKTLCDYGCSIGVSSRADGETSNNFNGQEEVMQDGFDLEGWDAVLLPAVKEARLKYVTESLDNKKSLKQTLNEQIDKASEDDKKVMKETLENLNIEYTPEKVIDKAANDVGATMIKDLQESLLAKEQAEAKVLELQEKLSVCYAKEAKYEEDISKYKTTIRNLSESVSKAKALEAKLNGLNEELAQKDLTIKEEQDKFKKALAQQRADIEKQSSLTESISNKNNLIREKESKIRALNEEFNSFKKVSQEKEKSLNESIAEMKKNLTIKTTEYNNKLAQSNNLVEQYRKTAKAAVNKYIDSQALRLGVNANEIKNKLPENYSFNDIDSICEGLGKFSLSVSNLPFNLQKGKTIIKESKEPINKYINANTDDSVDDSLLRLANLK